MYMIQYKLFKYSVLAMENKQLDTLEDSDALNSCKTTSEFVSSKENLKRNFDIKNLLKKSHEFFMKIGESLRLMKMVYMSLL